MQEDLGEFQEEVKKELNGIRKETEALWIDFDRGLKKTQEEVQDIVQNLLAEMIGCLPV